MRNRPPPLLRLSAEKGHSAVSPIDDFGNSSASHHSLTPTLFPSPGITSTSNLNHPPRQSNIVWSPSLLVPSPPDPPSTTKTSAGTRSRSLSSGAPSSSLFPPLNMFKINTRPRSPRRATSAMYPSMPDLANNPTSPATSMAVTEPLPRPFSPWGSTDSSTSTSPRASRMHKGFFGKRSASPTASLSATSAPASSVMAKSSKGFLGRRPRKNSPSSLDPDFDPTTFRKNRTRPALGTHGQDALYQEYEYLFDDSLEDSVNSEEDLSSHPSDADGNDDEDGYYLLRIKESVDSFSPRISPRTRSPPRSVPMSHRRNTSSGSLSDTPPTPPPKFRRSLVVTTTTPPRSSTTSLEEPNNLTATTVVSTPPTPPPKPTLFLDIESVDPEYVPQVKSAASEVSPPRRPPPPTPDIQDKRFAKRLSKIPNRPTSVLEGLGIINIPSPTLFYSSFIPGASDTWCGIADHATDSPALTSRSYTPRQPAARTNSYDETIAKGMSVLFDEEPGIGVVPLFSKRDSSSDLENTVVEETEMTQVAVEEIIAENPGDLSAAAENSIECLLNQLEATDSTKKTEEEKEIADKTQDSKDVPQAYSMNVTMEKDSETITAEETNNQATTTLAPAASTTNQESSSPKTVKSESDEKPATSTTEKEETPRIDSSYLKAFRGFVKKSGDSDPFIHRMPRFDALQAQRICSHLRNDYPLVASGKKAKSGSPNGVVTATVRQREAEEGILTGLWALMALRWMNFGRVVISPGHETLLAASAKRLTRRATTKMDQRATQMLENVSSGVHLGSHERRRVLDLGGAPIADWGWHCAYDYPKAKVYTVTTGPRPKQQSEGEEKAAGASDKCRGPQNHRPLVVSKLWKLPFPPNHFDVVSARNLYLTLKATVPENSPNLGMDEYDLCLEECLRVLKPGGHLEFSLFDHDIVNAGPLGAELAAKFAKGLESKGYDAAPTKRWVSRLNRAGFGEIKRSWIFLPMSPPSAKPKVPSKGEMQLPPHESQDLEMVKEEVRRKLKAWEDLGVENGSIENVSPVTGLVGSWIWEKWMLKTEGEGGGECDLAIDTIGDVLEEGREKGSGWRCLVGWARKPMFAGEH